MSTEYKFHTVFITVQQYQCRPTLEELADSLEKMAGAQRGLWNMHHSRCNPFLVFVEFMDERHKMLFDMRWQSCVKMLPSEGNGPKPSTMTPITEYEKY